MYLPAGEDPALLALREREVLAQERNARFQGLLAVATLMLAWAAIQRHK